VLSMDERNFTTSSRHR